MGRSFEELDGRDSFEPMILIDLSGSTPEVIAHLADDAGTEPARGIQNPEQLGVFDRAKAFALAELTASGAPYCGVTARIDPNPGSDGRTVIVSVAEYDVPLEPSGETRRDHPKPK
jgi:hypothetical protein